MVHITQKAHLLFGGDTFKSVDTKITAFVTERSNRNTTEPFSLEPKMYNFFQVEPSEKPCDPFVILFPFLSRLNFVVCSFC